MNSSNGLVLKMFLAFAASVFLVKSTVAVYFPPHMIIPAMPLKVVGDPYEETSKLPAIMRCPGFRRCEILEEDEERINNHLRETRCPLLPICHNRTSTTKKPATVTTLPVNITSTDTNTTANPITTISPADPTTVITTADPITTITTTDANADTEPTVALPPLPSMYADLLCPYLRTDLRDKAFVQKHAAVLKSIGCEIPPSESSSEIFATVATVVASDKANVTDTSVVAANGTSAVDQANGTNTTAVTNGTDTMVVANATAETNGTDTMVAANETNTTTVVDGTNTTIAPTQTSSETIVISETTTDFSLSPSAIDKWSRKRELRMRPGYLNMGNQ